MRGVTFRDRRPVLDCMNTILVTGATGNVGRPLVALLAEAGVDVRAVTRQPATAAFPAGVDVVSSALEGIRGADRGVPQLAGAWRRARDAVVELARRARRQRGLSRCRPSTPTTTSPASRRGSAATATRRLNSSPSSRDWNGSACGRRCSRPTSSVCGRRRSGRATWSAARIASASTAPIVDADISAVAAHALLRRRPAGTQVPLTGPAGAHQRRARRRRSALRSAARCAIRRCHPISVRQRFIGHRASPPSSPTPISALLAATVSKPALVTHDVEKILGRPAATFADAVRPSPRPVHQLTKETTMSELRPPPLAQTDEQLVKAVQRLGIPTGPAMVLTVPGRKTGKPRSTPMTPFDHAATCTRSPDIPVRTGRPTPAPQVQARCPVGASRGRSRSSNSTPTSRGRYCASSPSRFPSASVSPSARGLVATAPRTSSRRWQANWRCSGSTRELAGDVGRCSLHADVAGRRFSRVRAGFRRRRRDRRSVAGCCALRPNVSAGRVSPRCLPRRRRGCHRCRSAPTPRRYRRGDGGSPDAVCALTCREAA